MSSKRCGVFSCMGLGDGLIALVLANNLQRNGRDVVVFHPFLSQLYRWFPHVTFSPFPSSISSMEEFDEFFIFYEKSPWMEEIIQFCKGYPKKTYILNPIATPNRDYPYWEVGRFDGRRPVVDNLFVFCSEVLHLQEPTKGNGIVIPSSLTARRFEKRVVIHPTSSRPGKNWSKEKFLALAKKLKKEGFDPSFILSAQERAHWNEGPHFSTLQEMAAYVCESGFMIGNDSGIGHLASCLGLPTVTICRSSLAGNFWRPGWSAGELVVPPSWIPNLKGFRLRDKKWKQLISTSRVMKAFRRLVI